MNKISNADTQRYLSQLIEKFADKQRVQEGYLLWNSLKHKPTIISFEQATSMQDDQDLIFYLEREKIMYSVTMSEVTMYIEQLEPWSEVDAYLFDASFTWLIAFTHEEVILSVRIEGSSYNLLIGDDLNNIESLVSRLRTMHDCIVHPPMGLPAIEEGLYLPPDLTAFYKLCGGADLFINTEYRLSLVSPNQFVLANPVIVGERYEEDISSDWYILASDGNGDYLTVDLQEKRLGKCYDSFWDSHGVVGQCPVIARSFTELLANLMKGNGKRRYWSQDDFVSLGDAYDDITNV
ncbi:SMI1/KNR4 family protein [Paenibacillus sp. P25]|nr:SMI1/KNR4 family protein [Paenibacillus sp. P25]